MTPSNDGDLWIRCETLFTPYQRRENHILHIRDGKICAVVPADSLRGIPSGSLVDEGDAIVAPGFIDLHVHGARGRDLMDGTFETLQTVADSLALHGTTSFLATTLSAPDADTEIALRGFAEHHTRVFDGARPLGIHMEGPYLNPVRRGTHDTAYLKPASAKALTHLVEVSGSNVRKITVAPEMDEGLELTRRAVQLGIQVSIGHSDATVDQARAAIDAGATQATHTFNAMRPFHQREPGILGAVLTDDRVYAEVIADGIHVHPSAVRLLVRMKGIDRVLLVTDGLSAVGMPDGRYPLGDKVIVVVGGECRDSNGALAGSTLTLDQAVRNLVEWLDLPPHEAIAAASASPARSMQIAESCGIIAPGAMADLVFLDQNLRVRKTMVAGRIVYSRH